MVQWLICLCLGFVSSRSLIKKFDSLPSTHNEGNVITELRRLITLGLQRSLNQMYDMVIVCNTWNINWNNQISCILTIKAKQATAQNENRVSISPQMSPAKLPSPCCSPFTYLTRLSISTWSTESYKTRIC